MKTLFLNSKNGLRNGCWVVIFIAALTIAGFLQVALQWIAKEMQLAGGLWVSSLGMLAVLGATWAMLKLRRENWTSVGLGLDKIWAQQFGVGVAIGIAQILFAVLLLWVFGGVILALDPTRSLQTVGSGLILFSLLAIKEEVLFRGFLFQRLRDGMGLWPTQILLAVLFAAAHWMNPGMHGAIAVAGSLGIFVSAIVFGMAYVRTGSLALPVGIHLGWNWMQGQVMGFGVSGKQMHGWLQPTLLDKPGWLTGADFGIEASVLGVAVDLLLLAGLFLWKRSILAGEPALGLHKTAS